LWIAALILTFPISIIANISTPKILNWWSARSIASLKQRIAKLESNLATVQAIPAWSSFEHCVMYALERIAWLIMSVGTLIIGLVIILSVWYESSGHRIPDFIFLLLFLLTCVKMVTHAVTYNSLSGTVSMGTEKGRAELRGAIAKLKATLAAKGSAPS
jgi:hypothetical protein